MQKDFTEITEFIDKKINETIHTDFYGKLTFYLTNDNELTKRVERATHIGARIVMFYDRYMEINDPIFKEAYEQSKIDLLEACPILDTERLEEIYNNTIDPFWIYEKSLLNKKEFNFEDRENYSRMKSSDVPFYLAIIEEFVGVPQNFKDSFRALQRVNDIYDDLIDLEEDIEENSPNLVLLFNKEYKNIKNLKSQEIEEILERMERMINIVNQSIELPFLLNEVQIYKNNVLTLLKNNSPY